MYVSVEIAVLSCIFSGLLMLIDLMLKRQLHDTGIPEQPTQIACVLGVYLLCSC